VDQAARGWDHGEKAVEKFIKFAVRRQVEIRVVAAKRPPTALVADTSPAVA
jgi:hypothetical protein